MNVVDHQYGIQGFDGDRPEFVIPLQTPLRYDQARRALAAYQRVAGPNNPVKLVARPMGDWEEVKTEPITLLDWATEMERRDFAIDLHVSPPLAYMGPRFNPFSTFHYPLVPKD